MTVLPVVHTLIMMGMYSDAAVWGSNFDRGFEILNSSLTRLLFLCFQSCCLYPQTMSSTRNDTPQASRQFFDSIGISFTNDGERNSLMHAPRFGGMLLGEMACGG